MKIILIRHGKTEESEKKILLGHLPGHLSFKGKIDMKLTAKAIKKLNLNLKIIFSSDLKRAKDSSEIISKELKLKIKYDRLLKERKGGASEGKTEKEIHWKSYEKTSFPYRRHIGGESFIEVKKRAKKFLDNALEKEKRNFIIVSHSVFLSMLLSYIKNWSMKKSSQFNFNNSITIIDTKDKRVERIPLS